MKKTKTIISAFVILALVSCSTLPGNDPVVVNAEKITAVAYTTIDTFLKLEYENQALVKSKLPQVHAFAEQLRQHAQAYLQAARDATKAYKAAKNSGTASALDSALNVLTDLTANAQTYSTQVKNSTP